MDNSNLSHVDPRTKFDIQLGAALEHEGRLKEILETKTIELKTETYQWERTGNICVEYEHAGKPSGVAATEADYWVHELRRDDGTLLYLMFPIDRFKQLVRRFWHTRREGGDGNLSRVVLIPLNELFR